MSDRWIRVQVTIREGDDSVDQSGQVDLTDVPEMDFERTIDLVMGVLRSATGAMHEAIRARMETP